MHTQSTNATPSPGAAARALLLVRWLLVLLLVWDQIGAPLHHHRHDFGIDGQWVGASLHGGQSTLDHSAQDHQDPRIGHSVLAVRPQFDLGACAPGGNPGDGRVFVASIVMAAADDAAPQFAGSESGEPRQTYRSLPPAGRAPPFHS